MAERTRTRYLWNMVRRALVVVAAVAVAAACVDYGVDDPPSAAGNDGGAPADGGLPSEASAAPEGGGADAGAGDGGLCPLFAEPFDGPGLLHDPWKSLDVVTDGDLSLDHGRLAVQTKQAVAEYRALLRAPLKSVPTGLRCSFRFARRSPFASSNPFIDVFVLELTYADGSRQLLRLAYGSESLSLRDDFVTAGNSCQASRCPRGLAQSQLKLTEGFDATFEITIVGSIATARVNGVSVTRDLDIGAPTSAAILFGLDNFSKDPQSAWLDDLVCEASCP